MPRSRPTIGTLVLMAGKGTRLKSERAKVLHPILGQLMGWWVLQACEASGLTQRVLVVGHQAEQVAAAFPGETTALQQPQNGTGHAVKIGLKQLAKSAATVVVVNGDTPLLTPETIDRLLKIHTKRRAACTLAVTEMPDPTGYGRVFVNADRTIGDMVEHKDCTAAQRACATVNAGCYVFDRAKLEKFLKKLSTKNAQGEEYLTDVPRLLIAAGELVLAVDDGESFAVMPNTQSDLALAGIILQQRLIEDHCARGVAIPEPASVYIEPTVRIAPDTAIWGGCYLRGRTQIDAGAVIGPNADLTDTKVGKGATVRYSVADSAEIGPRAKIGPYAHLRTGTVIGADSRIGNFVETKQARLAKGVKAGHLSYLGDVTIGAETNIGAGTITCNYDGVTKHPTTIGAGVFIGSDTVLVAPVAIGDGGYTAAGSAITEDVPPGHLAFGRARQVNKNGEVLRRVQARQRHAKSQGD